MEATAKLTQDAVEAFGERKYFSLRDSVSKSLTMRNLQSNGQPNSPRLNWSSLQPLLETAVPHVLIILDCCFAANAARDTTEGTTKEILAACGRENPTPAVCNRSFTSALVEEMQSFGDTPFTVAMLHARLITMRWRLRFTPVHALLAEHGGNSITLSRLQETGNLFVRQTDRPAASTTEFDGTAPAVPDGSRSKGEQLPPLQVPPLQTADSRVLLSVSVTQGAELELAEWTRWLTSAVPWDVMKVDVQIHGIFRSHSSLVLVSMPINAWNLLSDRPAYRFIGFIRSDNLLKKAGSTEATGVVTRSRSRWPEFVCAKRENTTDFNKMTLRGQVPGQASFTAIKAIMGPPSSRHFSPLWQPPQALSSGHWNLGDDEALIQARAMGLNWQPIANQYFPGKTPNACRKRHERLMEKRNEEEQKRWDNANYESLAKAYTDVREQMWKILADRLGEEWQTVERRVSLAGQDPLRG